MQSGDCFCNDVFQAMQTVDWQFKITRFEYVTLFSGYYRPQRSWSKVIFLHLSVSHSVHRGFCHTPLVQTPPGQTPPLGRPLWADTPIGRHHPGQTPPAWTPTPLCAVHAGMRSTSGQYTSCWNAYLFHY